MNRFIILPEGDSSQSILARMYTEGRVDHLDSLMVVNQTAGRGQRGNSWEAEPGQNVTMSILLIHDSLKASDQFIVSQLISVVITDMLRDKLGDTTYYEQIAVKWPNDIYVGDRKIAGILIESSISGNNVERSIVGIGLNVNQVIFRSDAPNPVSMAQLLGNIYEKGVEHIGRELSRRIADNVRKYRDGILVADEIRQRYMSILWRREGLHPFTDVATDESFMASITGVESMGYLHLLTETGEDRRYAFKEVVFLPEC